MRFSLTQLRRGEIDFPNPNQALNEPNGLLAVGGDLSCARLINGYRQGIFPWYEPQTPILWWSPDPRGILIPERLHIGRSLRKWLKQQEFELGINTAFAQVISACAAPRPTSATTWIAPEMQQAYLALHQLGYAHSIEIWQRGILVAGLYGLSIGKVFCGESIFSHIDNGAKAALVGLCRHFTRFGGALIDCQMQNPFLKTMGISEMSRSQFLPLLQQLRDQPLRPGAWQAGRFDYARTH